MKLTIYVGWTKKKKGRREVVDTLKYINDNKKIIAEMGVVIQIKCFFQKHLTQKVVKKLADGGIRKFPTMVSDNNTKYVEKKAILDLFERNKQRFLNGEQPKQSNKPKPKTCDFGSDPLLEDHYRRMMDPADGQDARDETSQDLEKRMRDAQKNQPRHRTMGKASVEERRGQIPTQNNEEDNIPDHQGGYSTAGISDIIQSAQRTTHEEGNAGDDDMERAMLEKIGGGGGFDF